MLPAPAAIPATRHPTFTWAFTPHGRIKAKLRCLMSATRLECLSLGLGAEGRGRLAIVLAPEARRQDSQVLVRGASRVKDGARGLR